MRLLEVKPMWSTIWTWLRARWRTVRSSIAFMPMVIVLLFVVGAVLLLLLDRSDWGVRLKEGHRWLGLRDASAARTIVSTVAAGILSLAVFSFSMVMVVLNQAASQLSNRTLDDLIGDRFQQVVLGTYIGTIVHALLLLTTVREFDQGASIPALSIYTLIAFTVINIFLFIYFLHFITRAVKYEVIIDRIHDDTEQSMRRALGDPARPYTAPGALPFAVRAQGSGLFEGAPLRALIRYCTRHDVEVELTELPGSFVLRGAEILRTNRPLAGRELDALLELVPLTRNATVDGHYSFGFRQLTEVAMKALSPGMNDPGTALLCLRRLFRLFLIRLEHDPELLLTDKDGRVLVRRREWPFSLLFTSTLHAIWDYGKTDRSIRHELRRLLEQLPVNAPEVNAMRQAVDDEIARNEGPGQGNQ
ncbi:MAG: DUF2254 domain-containing protein [Flavobacteriales bacterium]|nr:DUF2254 domain-containing protein [Flavobacteriales bacterium]